MSTLSPTRLNVRFTPDSATVSAQSSARVLNSWKEIAAYLGRGVRTLQRYEQLLGLPIHRTAAKERGSVLPFPDELELWLRRTPIRNCVSADANGECAPSRLQLSGSKTDLQRAKEEME